MNRFEAIEILEEVKMLDDSMYHYNDTYMEALDYVIELVKRMDADKADLIERAMRSVDCSWKMP